MKPSNSLGAVRVVEVKREVTYSVHIDKFISDLDFDKSQAILDKIKNALGKNYFIKMNDFGVLYIKAELSENVVELNLDQLTQEIQQALA
jgi:hypothetical protein